MIFSAPPLVNNLYPVLNWSLIIKVVILFLFESKGNCLYFPSSFKYFSFSTLIDDLNLYKKSIKALSVLFLVSHISKSPLIFGSFNLVIVESTFNDIATLNSFQNNLLLNIVQYSSLICLCALILSSLTLLSSYIFPTVFISLFCFNSKTFFPVNILKTFISFFVKVPVLSVQI